MSRETAPVTALLAALIVGVYVLERALGGEALCAAYGLTPAHPSFSTAVTSLFLHDPGNLLHVGGNLAFLVIFAPLVEREVGSLRFLALFLTAGLGGAALHVAVDPHSTAALVGCSGSLFGVLALAGVLRPRLLGFVVAFVGLNIWNSISGGGGNVSASCHLGGFLIGSCVVVAVRMRRDLLEVA